MKVWGQNKIDKKINSPKSLHDLVVIKRANVPPRCHRFHRPHRPGKELPWRIQWHTRRGARWPRHQGGDRQGWH